MTNLEEERSRFEKWWEKEMQTEPSADSVSKSYARDAWMVRAALEDRQVATPIKEGLKDLSVRLLREFAEIQPPYDHDNECSFCGVKEGKQHQHTCSWLTARTIFGIGPGVPSEAIKKAICPGCHSGDPKKHGYIVGRPATFDNVCFGEFHEPAPSEATPSKENERTKEKS